MPLEDQTDAVWIRVPLDRETVARLMNLSDICHAEPHKVAASLLRDVLKDDEEMHAPAATAPGSPTIN